MVPFHLYIRVFSGTYFSRTGLRIAWPLRVARIKVYINSVVIVWLVGAVRGALEI